MFFAFLVFVSSWELDAGSIRGYYSLQEVQQILNTTEKGRTETIGYTVENREIKALILGEGKTKILVVGLHHARELISVTQVLDIINSLQEEKFKHLLEKAEIWLIPALNVDGLAYISEKYIDTSHIKNIRKNRQPECRSEISLGVDLNRNYGSNWGENDIGSSGNPCAEDYRGKSPFSEPETQAIQYLAEMNFTLALSYHSWGDDYFTPFCSSEKIDSELLREGYTEIFEDLEKVVCESCKIGTSKELIGYEVNGCFADYMYDMGAFTVSIEIGGSFHPNIDKIESVIEKHRDAWVFLFERSLPYLKIEEEVSPDEENGTIVSVEAQNIGLSSGLTEFYVTCSQKISSLSIESDYVVDEEIKENKIKISIDLLEEQKVEVEIRIQPEENCEVSRSLVDLADASEIENKEESPGIFYEVIIGVVCLLLILGIILVIFSRKRRKREYSTVFQPHDSEIDASYV